jgi:hypothetical protein
MDTVKQIGDEIFFLYNNQVMSRKILGIVNLGTRGIYFIINEKGMKNAITEVTGCNNCKALRVVEMDMPSLFEKLKKDYEDDPTLQAEDEPPTKLRAGYAKKKSSIDIEEELDELEDDEA